MYVNARWHPPTSPPSCAIPNHVSTQVSTSRAAADDDEPSAAAAAAVGAAKGRLVSAMMKKHLCEAVVPVLIELKRLLERRRHALLGDLMVCIAAMLRDYKHEVRPDHSDHSDFSDTMMW